VVSGPLGRRAELGSGNRSRRNPISTHLRDATQNGGPSTVNNVSKPFYFGSYLAATVLAALLTIGLLIAGEGKIEEAHLPFAIVSSLIAIYAFVVLAILIYKMWKALPAGVARTTPGKAVGFLFIPLFNFYWWFPALWGWAQDWNSYAAKSEGKLPRISEGLPLSIAVFGAIGGSIGTIAAFAGAPWLGMVLAGPNYVLIPIFIFQVCNLLNNAPAVPDEPVPGGSPALQQAGTRSLGVASLVLGILSIPLPYLGLVCGIVAIVLARKQRKVFCEPLSMAGLITGIIGTVFWGLAVVVVVLITALSLA